MTIDTYQRLTLLSDILRSHQLDGTGTVSEYEQAGRIARALLDEGNVEDLHDILLSIQEYTSTGAEQSDAQQYILNNQSQLDQWVQSLDQFS